MKNTFKKMSIFAATVLMGLVGCGKTDNPTTSIDPTTSNPTTVAPTPTTTAPEPTTLQHQSHLPQRQHQLHLHLIM